MHHLEALDRGPPLTTEHPPQFCHWEYARQTAKTELTNSVEHFSPNLIHISNIWGETSYLSVSDPSSQSVLFHLHPAPYLTNRLWLSHFLRYSFCQMNFWMSKGAWLNSPEARITAMPLFSTWFHRMQSVIREWWILKTARNTDRNELLLPLHGSKALCDP